MKHQTHYLAKHKWCQIIWYDIERVGIIGHCHTVPTNKTMHLSEEIKA